MKTKTRKSVDIQYTIFPQYFWPVVDWIHGFETHGQGSTAAISTPVISFALNSAFVVESSICILGRGDVQDSRFPA